MMKLPRLTCLFSALGLITTLNVAAPAFADSDEVVGSWSVIAVHDATGQSDPFLATYGSEGNVINSGPTPGGTVVAHGAWKETDSGTFTTATVSFSADGSSGAAKSIVEVSADGNTYLGVFEAKIRLPDGTLIATATGTLSATRIAVDSDDDSDSD